VVGWHVAKRGDRLAALEPLQQGARDILGGFHKDVARGVKIRCDWGPQYFADSWSRGGPHEPDGRGRAP